MQKIWISGVNGQIGKEIENLIQKLEYEIFDTDIEDIDITDLDEVTRFGEMNRPDIIVNCSAITDIEKCEENAILAYRVNALGARNLGIISKKVEAKFVQISTDDVFDGKSDTPYCEYDLTNPVTVYGKSKLAGEQYTKEFTNKHFIIRSSWVYGSGDNFVLNIIKKADAGEKIIVPSDMYGTPTSAKELAKFILRLINTNEFGTYHATNAGQCSREEFAKEILTILNKQADIQTISSKEYSVLQNRPDYAVLNNFVLSMIPIYQFPEWKDSLKTYLLEGGMFS